MRLLRNILPLPLLMAVVTGFPSGAPESACQSMMPDHMNDPLKSSPPYRVVFRGANSSTPTYMPGDEVSIRIEGRGDEYFRGFLLQAHTKSGEMVGQFFTDTSRVTKILCQEKAVTHKKWGYYESASTTWRAPAESKGDLVFVATIVRRFAEFWVNVTSATIKDVSKTLVTPPVDNPNGSCVESDLVSLSPKRPLVAIMCGMDSHCPCGWRCCQWCPIDGAMNSSTNSGSSTVAKQETKSRDQTCYGHAVCREPANEHSP